MIKVETLTQVGMLQECSDLIDNGYVMVHRHIEKEWWYFKYRHSKNGRTLSLQWRPDFYVIKEGSKILKQVSD